jgi:hypothetical protein
MTFVLHDDVIEISKGDEQQPGVDVRIQIINLKNRNEKTAVFKARPLFFSVRYIQRAQIWS